METVMSIDAGYTSSGLTKERGCAPIMPRADAIEARDHSSKLRNGGRYRGPDRGGIMRNIAVWRRVRHTEAVSTATVELNPPAAPLHCKAPMPLRRWSLQVVPVLAAAIACNAVALANEPEPSVAAPRSEVSCHDQFMIDRRDEPARALRDLQQ